MVQKQFLWGYFAFYMLTLVTAVVRASLESTSQLEWGANLHQRPWYRSFCTDIHTLTTAMVLLRGCVGAFTPAKKGEKCGVLFLSCLSRNSVKLMFLCCWSVSVHHRSCEWLMNLWIRLKLSFNDVLCNNINSIQSFFPARNDSWLIFTLSPF